ncbi:MAG: hypothetical protein HQK75_01185 [Candidatus Magnetomorum sp.]|nr:hypothetical protein [Candidatus Magnetomorum sp.]
MPVWTHNVESAQVLANVMHYPDENPMNIGHRGLYSLFIQIPALFLMMGIPEWSLCILFSGLQCAIAFSAVSLIAFIFSRHLIFSLTFPVLLLHLSICQKFWPNNYMAVFHGHGYPMLFPLNTSLYGIIGIFSVLLIFCFFSLGWNRSSAFCVGLLPSIHPTLAIACWIGMGTCVGCLVQDKKFRSFLNSFLVGFCFFGISALIHFLFSGTNDIKLPADIHQCISQTFVSDHHALTDHFSSSMDGLKFFEPEIYVLILFFFLTRIQSLPAFLFRFIIPLTTVILVCTLYVPVALFFPQIAHSYPMDAMMIPRWLNLSSIAYPCIASGILIYHSLISGRRWCLWIVSGFIFLIVSGNISGITISSSLAAFHRSSSFFKVILSGWPLLMFLTCLTILIFNEFPTEVKSSETFLNQFHMKMILIFILVGLSVIDSLWIRNYKHVIPQDAEVLIQALKKDHGVLLTTSPFWELSPIQLKTHREILLDLSQLNGMYYLPQTIPAVRDIFQTIFHVDLCEPGESLSQITTFLEERSFQDWQIIASKYGLTGILTPRTLQLKLPICFQNKTYAVYCLSSGF